MNQLPPTELKQHLEHLRILGDVLLNPEESVERLRAACQDLEEILIGIHGVPSAVTAEDQRYRHASDFGEVISPGYAISTMQDAIRTAKFLRALVAAIRAKQSESPGERVHILYPGPGPNAPFFILAAATFSPKEISFTLIEYMQESFDAARSLVAAFGFEEYVHDFQHGDAVLYKHAGPPVHILIAEIMQQALRGEPQLAIFKNLVPQLSEDARLIPHKIELRAGLSDPEGELNGVRSYPLNPEGVARRIDLGEILTLSRESLLERHRQDVDNYETTQDWVDLSFKIPEEIGTATTFTIFTKIQVGEDLELLEGESGLSRPVYDREVPVIQAGDEVRCVYRLGPQPGLLRELRRPRLSIING